MHCDFLGEKENTTCIYSLQTGAKIWHQNKNDRLQNGTNDYTIPIFHLDNYSSALAMSNLKTAWHKIDPASSSWYQSKNVVFNRMDIAMTINNDIDIYNPIYSIVGDGNLDLPEIRYYIRITDPSKAPK